MQTFNLTKYFTVSDVSNQTFNAMMNTYKYFF